MSRPQYSMQRKRRFLWPGRASERTEMTHNLCGLCHLPINHLKIRKERAAIRLIALFRGFEQIAGDEANIIERVIELVGHPCCQLPDAREL